MHTSAHNLKWKSCEGLENKNVALTRLWVQITAHRQAEAMKDDAESDESTRNDNTRVYLMEPGDIW